MTNNSTPSRFIVRRGTVLWMIWDRDTRRPAKLGRARFAIELTEEQARELVEQLKLVDGETSPERRSEVVLSASCRMLSSRR